MILGGLRDFGFFVFSRKCQNLHINSKSDILESGNFRGHKLRGRRLGPPGPQVPLDMALSAVVLGTSSLNLEASGPDMGLPGVIY